MKLRYGTPEDAGMSSNRIKLLERSAQEWTDSGTIPTLIMIAARKGVIVTHKALGPLHGENGNPQVELNSLYPLASVTKPVTATAAMILVEEGLLRLNDPVSYYIPEFKGEGKEAVKVHHLMTHTSGLRGNEIYSYIEKVRGTVEIPPMEATQHPNIHEWLYLGYEAPLWKAPGLEMSYCNYGIDLLGEIIRRRSGKSLEAFAIERIFQPLGMKDTYYIVPQSERNRIVKHPVGGPFEGFPDDWNIETPSASGGLFSTAYDMAIFCQMFLNGGIYGDTRILSVPAVRQMTRNHIPGIQAQWGEDIYPEGSWGLCWDIHGSKKLAVDLWSANAFTHEGYGGSSIWADPDFETIGVYLSIVVKEHHKDTFGNMILGAIAE